MNSKKLTYNKAIDELKTIIIEMENSEPDVEALNNNVKRAVDLIKFCRSELYITEENINKILEDADLN
ncbi:MAG: exodeoxyribonuclease VII small subunit [Prevotellaceae bacterium]|jgi:exodeoxyribonuclease VII small subunit|nr:exodeoxyribonuclease VII small subunit [Prevotellaceae bacterium]